MRIDDPDRYRRIKRLKEKGIISSVQRLAVLKYVEMSTTHPTAEEIYKALKSKFPTLSKVTVSNVLRVLKEADLILELTMEKEKAHYDARLEHHHHFLCRRCHRIYDVDAGSTRAKDEYVNGHKIERARTYFYGLCASCLREGDYA